MKKLFARKKRNPRRSRRVKLALLIFMLAVAVGSNWYVHQPPEWRDSMAKKLPSFVVAVIEKAGNASAEYTDNLGFTGHDVFITMPAGIATNAVFFGAAPRATTNAPPNLARLDKTGFSIAYSPAHRHPWWVAYKVFPVESLATPKRPSQFKVDTAVGSPKHDEYTKSGYDRGHMAPNFAIASRYGEEAQKQTFLTSNICPQRPDNNQGSWRDIEHRIAAIYAQERTVWVIVGALPPAKAGDQIVDAKGRSTGISIPAAFYQIIVSEREGNLRVCALLVPQDAPRHAHPRRYLTSVREIERRTGLDFFNDLPPVEQDLLELPAASRLWPVGRANTWFILKDRLMQRAKRPGDFYSY